MKKIILSFLALFFAIIIIAQSPQAFKYQTVVRDNTGTIITNQAIGFRISILDGNAAGPILYQETHLANTNDYGLANLEIGSGTLVSGLMSDINWGTNDKFLQIEMDESGGTNYQMVGTSQLLSVPYALHSETTSDTTRWQKNADDLYYMNGKLGIGTTTPLYNMEIHSNSTSHARLKLSNLNYTKSLFFSSGTESIDPGIYIEGSNALRFLKYEEGVGYNVLMRITADGKVGIGTQMPEGILDIAGQYHFPSTDGSVGQILRTDGNGVLSWSSSTGGVSEINDLEDGSSDNSSVFLGLGTGINDDGDNQNVAVGIDALNANTSGYSNTAIGQMSLFSNNTGWHNTAYGNLTLVSNTLGGENTATGSEAMYHNIDGWENTAYGYQALNKSTNGWSNSAFGKRALFYNTTGSSNTAFGLGALYNNTSGHSNVAIGTDALFSNTNRSNLVAIGDSALFHNGENTGGTIGSIGNTAVGSKALHLNDYGHDNTALGYESLKSNTYGSRNTAVGSSAMKQGIGSGSSAFGANAMFTNNGFYNTAMGFNSLHNVSYGDYNVAIGAYVLSVNSGNKNTAVGYGAGGGFLGDGSIFIGYEAGSGEDESNKLYIDNSDTIAPLIYGAFDYNFVKINGKLSVGNEYGNNNLDVYGSTKIFTDLEVYGEGYINTKLEIGTQTTQGYKMSVTGPSGTLVRWNRTGSDGQVLDIQNDGTYAGGISFSGGSVSYNSFTGSHLAVSEKEYHYGELVSMTGENGNIEDQPEAEVVYGISKTSIANDKSVLGTYLGRFDGHATSSAGTLHNIMAVGNGRIWVVENGSNIAPGDYLISSATLGHAMKDPGSFPVSHIIARAAQTVDWENEYELIEGKKHKLISVTFESFDMVNSQTGSGTYVNQNINMQHLKKLDYLQKQIDQQNQLLKSQQTIIEEMQIEIAALKKQ